MSNYFAVLGIRIPVSKFKEVNASCSHINGGTNFKYCPECGTKVKFETKLLVTENELCRLCGKYNLNYKYISPYVFVGKFSSLSNDVEFVNCLNLTNSLSNFLLELNIELDDRRVGLFLVED